MCVLYFTTTSRQLCFRYFLSFLLSFLFFPFDWFFPQTYFTEQYSTQKVQTNAYANYTIEMMRKVSVKMSFQATKGQTVTLTNDIRIQIIDLACAWWRCFMGEWQQKTVAYVLFMKVWRSCYWWRCSVRVIHEDVAYVLVIKVWRTCYCIDEGVAYVLFMKVWCTCYWRRCGVRVIHEGVAYLLFMKVWRTCYSWRCSVRVIHEGVAYQ